MLLEIQNGVAGASVVDVGIARGTARIEQPVGIAVLVEE
jgi:hypothetical protein